jgi:Ca2+-binding EF-hand superfamily protein
MAPLILLFILGGLCALFSLTTSSRSAKKCVGDGDVKSGDAGKGSSEGEEEAEPEKKKQQQAARPAVPDPEADLSIVFSTFDHDGDGFITAVELEESLRRLGIAVSADEGAAMVARVDANSDGLIDIHEFRELYDSIPKKRKHQHSLAAAAAEEREVPVEDAEEEAEEEEERDLREAFDVFDGNKDGLISAEELGTVLGSLGLHRAGAGAGAGRPAVAECRDMIRLVDSDGDGMVSFEEFKRMMTVVKA